MARKRHPQFGVATSLRPQLELESNHRLATRSAKM
nr:MAG TPA: hypothetical protein [Caudoviricetes sp.]DAW51300.1 MAG TPA: hypothetical protein [Caudoviricetes sp.]